MLKRTFDFVCAGIGLLLVSPILLLVAIRIKWEDRGPVFYRGVRVGRFGKDFRIYKFRSMVINAEKLGGSSTSDNDNRITKVGKWVRKYKLDELPQLINVFVGDMSLVGPRPEVREYVDMYTEEEKIILSLRPGITDWASIWNSDEGELLKNSPDPEKTYLEEIRPTKLKYQMEYARKRSLWVDISILWETAKQVILRKKSGAVLQNERKQHAATR